MCLLKQSDLGRSIVGYLQNQQEAVEIIPRKLYKNFEAVIFQYF